ncbi:MAG: hypothetical protein HYW57_10815, partial [Ignavibacteriales bacterium]|nr:hypothetical protein [Ignavibacteriales bacterium]
SQNDQNRLSAIDRHQSGQAVKLTARYREQEVAIGSAKLGELDVSFSERYVDRKFVSLDRANEVEFGRKWNFDALPVGDEEIREASLLYRPTQAISVSAAYGSLERIGSFYATRTQGEADLSDSSIAEIHYTIEDIKSTDDFLGRRSSWLRQRGKAERDIGLVTPGISFETERRSIHRTGSTDLEGGSFRFWQISPLLSTDEVFRMRGTAEFQVRNEDSTISGVFREASQSMTQLYTWQLRDWNALSSSLSLSLRNTEFTEAFRQRGNLNSDVVMVRSQTKFTPWRRALEADVFYAFSNQRSARLERVFVRVAKGDGNYRYLGDINGNSIADENEFELTRFDGDYVVVLLPGETLHPVADLQASLRLRLQPARILEASVPFQSALASLSTETFLRLDEKSSDPNTSNIYLLRLSRFLNDQNTISGAQIITQDLHVFENQPEFSLRLRFSQRKGLLQLVSSQERSYRRERTARLRWQLVTEIANQTEFTNRRDRVLATVPTSRERDLVSNTLSSDFSYRPDREWEIGFRFEAGRVVDELRGDQAAADLNEQGLRLVYGFITKGQFRSELKREEVILAQASADPARIYPFEFTNGRVFGKTFLWSAGFDYRITMNIQISVQYDGRSEGGRQPVHFARAEARAFF